METAPQKQKQTEDSSDSPGRMDRIADNTRGLIEDVKEWIDLKVQLVQLEIEQKIETLANQVVSTFLVIVLAAVTALFILVAAALGLGQWLGHPAWGFLAVSGALGLVTILIHFRRPRLVKAPNILRKKALPESSNKAIKAELPEVASHDHEGTDSD